MPYIQPKSTNVFGFMPDVAAGTLMISNAYLVSSSEGFIAAGDVVIQSSLAPGGAAGMVVKGITGAAGVFSSAIVGVAAHCMLSDQGSTAVSLNNLTSGLLLVYDDPNERFVVSDQASSASGFLLSSQIGFGVSVLATGGVGSTGPFQSGSLNGRSNQVISGGLTTATALLAPFKLVGLHPVDNNTSSGIGRKWLVMINDGLYTPGTIQVTT